MLLKINKKHQLAAKIFLWVMVFCLPANVALADKISDKPRHRAAAAQACFVKPLVNKEYFPALLQAMDEAREEIGIAIFSFKAGIHPWSYPDILVEHMGRAVRRGVAVWVVLEVSANREDSLTRQNLKTRQLLEEKGVKVYLDSPEKTTHTKLVVIDRHLAFVGSHNFTPSGLRHNNEISILIDQPDVAQKIRQGMRAFIQDEK